MPPLMPCNKMYLGAVLRKNSLGEHVVEKLMIDSPAEQAGIEEGSVLYSVNGQSISGFEEEEVRDMTRCFEGSKLAVQIRLPGTEELVHRHVWFAKPATRGHRRDFITSIYNVVIYGHAEGRAYLDRVYEESNAFRYRGEWEDGKTRRIRRTIVAKLRNFPRIKAFAKWRDVALFPQNYVSDEADERHRSKLAACARQISFVSKFEGIVQATNSLFEVASGQTPFASFLNSLFEKRTPLITPRPSHNQERRKHETVAGVTATVEQRQSGSPLTLPYREEWALRRANGDDALKEPRGHAHEWEGRKGTGGAGPSPLISKQTPAWTPRRRSREVRRIVDELASERIPQRPAHEVASASRSGLVPATKYYTPGSPPPHRMVRTQSACLLFSKITQSNTTALPQQTSAVARRVQRQYEAMAPQAFQRKTASEQRKDALLVRLIGIVD
jgi:hypothetical protein